MSLQTRIGDLILAVGTDYKQIRTWITGSGTGDLTSLTTTTKTSIIAAINETRALATGAPPAASEAIAGVAEVATTTETTAGASDTVFVTPLKLQQKLAAFTVVAATETTAGIAEVATQAETTSGLLDTLMVTPLKLQQKLTAWAQPLNANLTTLAGVVSGTFGRTLLGTADAAAAKTALGLATVATSGSASDITTGTLPSSVMPPLVINDTFVVASQAAMLALVAQRGDIAKRTDLNGSPYILSTDSPGTLADWILLDTTSDVSSVAGRTGVVVLTKTDVGLSLVDNTSDVGKPVSTAQATAIGLKMDKSANLSDVAVVATARTNLGVSSTAEMNTALDLRLLKTANLSDLANAGTARTNLSVYSQAEIGNPETDLVAAYVTAKA